MYTAELFPYNWDPTTWVSPGVSNSDPTFSTDCKGHQFCGPYQPSYGHNIIYGGWGSDTIHGGPGQSAISGADAPVYAFTDNFAMDGSPGEHGADRDRLLPPVQPGQRDGLQPACRRSSTGMLRGPPARPSSTTSTRPTRGARSCSPRPAPTASGPPARARPAPAACRGSSTSTRRRSACRSTRSGTRAPGIRSEPVTGDDVIFGDTGNDWIVGGMGRVQVFGGWGNDVIDLRASHTVDNGLNDAPVPNLDGTFGTPAWEGLAYGGAGQDILFAGTVGRSPDRLDREPQQLLRARSRRSACRPSAGRFSRPFRTTSTRSPRVTAPTRSSGCATAATRRATASPSASSASCCSTTRLARAERASVQPDAREPRRRRHRHPEDCEHPAARLPRERLRRPRRTCPPGRRSRPGGSCRPSSTRATSTSVSILVVGTPGTTSPTRSAKAPPVTGTGVIGSTAALRHREPRSDRLPGRDGHGHRPR